MKTQSRVAYLARKFFIVTTLPALFLITGCASITKGTSDTLQVEIVNCGETITCEATNKKGTWEFTAPGSVTFKKSDNPLSISCKDGPETLTRSVQPTRGSMAWGNVVFGGPIGGGVDAATDAHWDIVDSVSLHRQYCRGKKVEAAE